VAHGREKPETSAKSRVSGFSANRDDVTTSKASILVGELAKILKQNGCDTGEKRLFAQFRKEGYLISIKKNRRQDNPAAVFLSLIQPIGSEFLTRF